MLYIADEVFFSGTAAEITPFAPLIASRLVRPPRPGCGEIAEEFFGIVNGATPDRYAWLSPSTSTPPRRAGGYPLGRPIGVEVSRNPLLQDVVDCYPWRSHSWLPRRDFRFADPCRASRRSGLFCCARPS